MTAPSNANTSGLLELIQARIGQDFDGECHLTDDEAQQVISALVTAASAQARIDEERALFKSLRVRKNFYKENMLAAEDRATAAEARADRLAKALERIARPEYGLGFNKLRGIARAALQQEPQP